MKHINLALECECEVTEPVEFSAEPFQSQQDNEDFEHFEQKATKLDEIGQQIEQGMTRKLHDELVQEAPALESHFDRSFFTTTPSFYGAAVALEAVENEKIGIVRTVIKKIREYAARFGAWLSERLQAFRKLAQKVYASASKTARDTIVRCEGVLRTGTAPIVNALRALIGKQKNKNQVEVAVEAAVKKFIGSVSRVTNTINGSPTLLYVYHAPESVSAQFDNLRENSLRATGVGERAMAYATLVEGIVKSSSDPMQEYERMLAAAVAVEEKSFTEEEIATLNLRLDMYADRKISIKEVRLANFMDKTIALVKDASWMKNAETLIASLNNLSKNASAALDELVVFVEDSRVDERTRRAVNATTRRTANSMTATLRTCVELASSCSALYGAVLTLQTYGSQHVLKAAKLMAREVAGAFEDAESKKAAKAAMEKMLAVTFE